MVLGTVLSLTTTLSLSCYYRPDQCVNSTNPSHPPPVIMYGHQNQTLMINDMAILPCQASGRIDPQIVWFRDSGQLNLNGGSGNGDDYSTSRFRQLSTGTLQISDLKKSDTGVYTCSARNEDGETSWTASLVVEEHTNTNTIFQRMPDAAAFPSAPGKPVILNVTDNGVELEWTAPDRHGATPIIGYILQYWSPMLKESWMNVLDVVPSTRFRVKHLQSNHPYAFVIRAENSKGIGPPSPISELATTKIGTSESERDQANFLIDIESVRQKLASGQLIKLQDVKALNSTAVLLLWRHQRREPLVQGYYIMWRGPPLLPDRNHSYVNVTDPDAEQVIISGLRPFTRYEFFMIPYHQSAQGMPSNSLITTTHEAPPSKPPSDVRLRMLNITSLRVSWRPPISDAINGILKGFIINIKSNQSEERNITTNERATSVTLYRLIADASYTIRVAARTTAGYGPFFYGEPVVMNDETLQDHMRQAIDARGLDWYKRPLSVLIVGIVLWCIFLLLIVLVWYRCCQRRNRKKMDSEKDTREFIKIRDGSVVAVGGAANGVNNTLARNAFWAGHDHYNTGSSVGGGCMQNNHHDPSCAIGTGSCFGGGCGGNSCAGGGSMCTLGGTTMTSCHQSHSHHHHHHNQPICEHECTNCNYGPDSECGGAHSGTLPPSSQLLYGMNGSCGGICNPTSCSTLQKGTSARSYSPSHHYHYAQLPDIREQFCGANDGISTFYNQASARQYYDDPSPYATTTLVMNGSVTQHHTPREKHRAGSTNAQQRTFGHHHPSGRNINCNGGNTGPALPLNPIPKEPPRNFLSNVAVGATDVDLQQTQHQQGCCQQQNDHANSCGALLELSSVSGISSCQNYEHNAQQRCTIADNQNAKCCAANSCHHSTYCNHHRMGTYHHVNGNCANSIHLLNGSNTARHSSRQLSKHHSGQRSSSVHNTIDSCGEDQHICGNELGGISFQNCGTKDPSNNSSPQRQDSMLNDYPLTHRNSPYTDVSYIHSSDGTNGSSKRVDSGIGCGTRAVPPGNILDLVPPPPNEMPPTDPSSDIANETMNGGLHHVNAVYDAVSDLFSSQIQHQRTASAEFNSAAIRSSMNAMNTSHKNYRKSDRYSSGSMSRNEKRPRNKPQPKSRLSLIERDIDIRDNENNSIGMRNGNDKYERDPLMSNYDFEADGELSEDDVDNAIRVCADLATKGLNHNISDRDVEIDEYFNNSGSNYMNQQQQQQLLMNNSTGYDANDSFLSQGSVAVKPRQPLMGVNASTFSQNSVEMNSNRMSTSQLQT